MAPFDSSSWLNKIPQHIFATFSLSIHLWWPSWKTPSLATVGDAAVRRNEQVCLSDVDIDMYFACILMSATAQLNGRSIFSILRNSHIDFRSVCISLHSQQWWSRLPLSLHPCLHGFEWVVVLLMVVILTGMGWDFKTVWIYVSLKAKDVEQLYTFTSIFGHLYLFFWKLFSPSVCQVIYWLEDLWLWYTFFFSVLKIIPANTPDWYIVGKDFLFSLAACLFTLVIVSFALQRLFILVFFFSIWIFKINGIKSHCWDVRVEDYFLGKEHNKPVND